MVALAWRTSLVLSLGFFAALACAPAALGQPTAAEPLAAALDRRADFKFEHAHLQDVVQQLRRDFKIDIRLDDRALEGVGVQLDKALVLGSHKKRMEQSAKQLASNLAELGLRPAAYADLLKQVEAIPYSGISFQQSDVTLRSALHHLLADYKPQLAFVVQNNILWITTPEEASDKVEVRVYTIGDELAAVPAVPQADTPFDVIPKRKEVSQFDYEPLLENIQKSVAPTSWDNEGGRGAVHAGDGSLTVTQTSQNHELVSGLLATLRQVRAEMQKAQPSYAPHPVNVSRAIAQREAEIAEKLRDPANFDYQKMPLADVLADLSKRFGIALRLDRHALNEINVQPQTPVTFQQQNVSLLAGLEMMLNQIDPMLAYSIDHEVVLITTREKAADRPRLVVYPVRDIISASVTAADAEKRPDLWDVEPLIENIQKSIDPSSWDSEGGQGSIAVDPVAGALIVSQTEQGHQGVARLIADLRKIARARPKPEQVKPDAKKEADPYVTVVFRLWQPYHEQTIVKEEDLVKFLKETVQKDSWNGPEVQVRTLPSRLIIRQRVSVQRQIYAALESLAVIKPEEPAAAGGTFGGFGGFGGGGGGFGGQFGAGQLPGGDK